MVGMLVLGAVELYHWHNEPLLIGGLLFLCWAYAVLTGPMREVLFGDRPLARHQPWCFYGSVALFYLTVGSPLDALGEGFLFSAHMLQHNLLMYAVPPLFFLGIPEWMVDRWLSGAPKARAVLRWLTQPVVAGFCFTFVFSIWHLPALYDGALRVKWLHVAQHILMLATSLQMWWGFLGPSRLVPSFRAGTQLIYLFAMMVAQLPLFAVLTFESSVLYDTYFWAQRITSLSAHEDQVLGGLLMKVANMVVSLGLMGMIFLTWERRQHGDTLRARATKVAPLEAGT